MASNVGKSLIAKQRMICQRIDEGYEIVVPENQKWHPSHRRQRDFVNKLNTASISLLNQSFDKMLKPFKPGESRSEFGKKVGSLPSTLNNSKLEDSILSQIAENL